MATPCEASTRIIELMDEGVISPRAIADMCIQYMSEDDVADMARLNGLFDDEDDEDDTENNG